MAFSWPDSWKRRLDQAMRFMGEDDSQPFHHLAKRMTERNKNHPGAKMTISYYINSNKRHNKLRNSKNNTAQCARYLGKIPRTLETVKHLKHL
jgi:hypothetical protein